MSDRRVPVPGPARHIGAGRGGRVSSRQHRRQMDDEDGRTPRTPAQESDEALIRMLSIGNYSLEQFVEIDCRYNGDSQTFRRKVYECESRLGQQPSALLRIRKAIGDMHFSDDLTMMPATSPAFRSEEANDLIALMSRQGCTAQQSDSFAHQYRNSLTFRKAVWTREAAHRTGFQTVEYLNLRCAIAYMEVQDIFSLIPDELKSAIAFSYRLSDLSSPYPLREPGIGRSRVPSRHFRRRNGAALVERALEQYVLGPFRGLDVADRPQAPENQTPARSSRLTVLANGHAPLANGPPPVTNGRPSLANRLPALPIVYPAPAHRSQALANGHAPDADRPPLLANRSAAPTNSIGETPIQATRRAIRFWAHPYYNA